jgi:hypothetical protein
MIKVMFSIAAVTAFVSGCNYRTDYSKDIAPTIICVKAPIGGVTPDDVYVSKMGQPVVVRCPPNMVPKVVIGGGPENPNTPGTPVTPGKPKPDAPQPTEAVELSQSNPGGATAAMKTPTGIEGSRAGYGDGAVAVQDGRTLRSDAAKDLVAEIFGDVGI